MLSKEEIEKNIKLFESVDLGDDIEFIKARKNLIQYIDQLEQENNKLNKIIDETTKYIAKVDDDIFCDEDKYERDIEDNVIGCDEDCEECVKQHFEKKVEGK